MSQNYRIESIGQKAVWDNDSNKGDYPAKLAGDDREVMFFHDSSSNFDPPKIGDEAFGDIEKDKRGNWRFKRKSKPKGSGGGGGGGYSPADIARMSRSHAQEMALRFIAATGDAHDMQLSEPAVVGAYLNETVKRITDWFTRDVENAEEAVVVKANSNGGGEVPADMTGLPGGTPDPHIAF